VSHFGRERRQQSVGAIEMASPRVASAFNGYRGMVKSVDAKPAGSSISVELASGRTANTAPEWRR